MTGTHRIPETTHVVRQAMQRGLVNHRAGHGRIAVVFQIDCPTTKPVCPLTIKMALYADLTEHSWTWISLGAEFVLHRRVHV
jgi:hypothetical protein